MAAYYYQTIDFQVEISL